MIKPLSFRNGIPLFISKTELETKQDVYERYDGVVIKQTALHLADDLWGEYPMQAVLDFAKDHYPSGDVDNILELGSGVGRWIATLAQKYPQSNCWGIDYSYQMLKRADEFWVKGKELIIDLKKKGAKEIILAKGMELTNINFGLSKASELPFEDNSQDIITNSFLIDRLTDPVAGLREMKRVLKENGKLIVVSPLNYNKAKHWEKLYPPIKIYNVLLDLGFIIEDWKEDMVIEEPLDLRGNSVVWKCIAFVAVKL